jgi:hypothetical protein
MLKFTLFLKSSSCLKAEDDVFFPYLNTTHRSPSLSLDASDKELLNKEKITSLNSKLRSVYAFKEILQNAVFLYAYVIQVQKLARLQDQCSALHTKINVTFLLPLSIYVRRGTAS